MARLVKSARVLDSSVMLSSTSMVPRTEGAAHTETPLIAEALSQLPSPTGAIEAVARQIEAQAASQSTSSPRDAEVLADLKKEAREKGYEEGYAKGLDKGQAEAARTLEQDWKARLERLDSLLDALEQARRISEETIEDAAVTVAFESVAKIVGRKSVSIEVVREMVSAVCQDGSEAGPIVVRVGSDDYEALVNEPFIIELEEDRGRIRLVEDPRVAFGGCIIETSRGSTDARLEMQLDRLQKILIEARRTEET